jgi:formate dehydrogenase subunit delta
VGEHQVTAAVPPVVRLANDIARQFAHLPPPEAAQAVAAHLHQFWEPRMLTALAEEVAHDPERLDPLVVDALAPPPA